MYCICTKNLYTYNACGVPGGQSREIDVCCCSALGTHSARFPIIYSNVSLHEVEDDNNVMALTTITVIMTFWSIVSVDLILAGTPSSRLCVHSRVLGIYKKGEE